MPDPLPMTPENIDRLVDQAFPNAMPMQSLGVGLIDSIKVKLKDASAHLAAPPTVEPRMVARFRWGWMVEYPGPNDEPFVWSREPEPEELADEATVTLVQVVPADAVVLSAEEYDQVLCFVGRYSQGCKPTIDEASMAYNLVTDLRDLRKEAAP